MIREFHQISLRGRNSFGVDQRAARLVEFETAEDLRTFFAAGIPGRWTVLAGGNNILFTEDYDGVLQTPVARQIALLSDDGDEVRLRVEAGVEWDDLVEWAVERGLWGIENLSLIPGKAGSAPVQNIGAYGCEAKDAIRRVEMYCVETGNLLTLDAAHCGFGYRESVFKHDLKGRVIITAIEIRLSHTPRPKLGYGDVEREVEARGGATLRNIREAICSIRRAKLPDPAVLGNAGSFFKNPVVEAPVAERLLAEYPDMPHYAAPEGRVKLAAGWLIDRAGMKGYREGSVGVHERQALVLVNPCLKLDFLYIVKQRGGLFAKGRLLGLQFAELFRDGLYYELARRANGEAMRIKAALTELGVAFQVDSPTNQQFIYLSEEQADALRTRCTYDEEWRREGRVALRLCTSWATQLQAVDELIAALREIIR